MVFFLLCRVIECLQVGLFSTFASNNGNPNGELINEWESIATPTGPFKCLNINNDGLQFIEYPEQERMQFWDSLYSKDKLY